MISGIANAMYLTRLEIPSNPNGFPAFPGPPATMDSVIFKIPSNTNAFPMVLAIANATPLAPLKTPSNPGFPTFPGPPATVESITFKIPGHPNGFQ